MDPNFMFQDTSYVQRNIWDFHTARSALRKRDRPDYTSIDDIIARKRYDVGFQEEGSEEEEMVDSDGQSDQDAPSQENQEEMSDASVDEKEDMGDVDISQLQDTVRQHHTSAKHRDDDDDDEEEGKEGEDDIEVVYRIWE